MDLSDCDQIYKRALDAKTAEQFSFACEPLLKTYKILSVGFGRGNIYWRARIISSEKFARLNDMDYPPPEKCGNGRLNKKGWPWFYASASIETALKEVGAAEGDLVQLAGFRILKDKYLHLLVLGEYSSVQKRGYTQLNGTDPGGTIRKLLDGHRSKAQVVVSIDRFFSSVLSDPVAHQNEYMRTQSLARLLLREVAADGVAFPSVKDPGGTNFGVEAKASDRIFHNVACVVARAGRSYMQDMLEYEVISSATGLTENDTFVWHDKPQVGQYFLYGMTKEEHDFAVANDPDGKDPHLVLSMYDPGQARHA